MLARKCDRCGNLYEMYIGDIVFGKSVSSNGIIFAEKTSDNSFSKRENIDLCQECMQELADWLEEGKRHS